MSQETERHIRPASAGIDDREDVIIRCIPEDGCDGMMIEILDREDSTDAVMIEEIVRKVLEEHDLNGIRVEVLDRGAVDYVVRARTIAAVQRALRKERTLKQRKQTSGQREQRVDDRGGGTKVERLRRSRIYIPGNRPRMIRKATGFGADAIILDLEDSVPPEEKDAARILVSLALLHEDFRDAERMVRINPLNVCGEEDLRAILPSGPDSIVLPKCECAGDIMQLEEILCTITHPRPVAIMPLIETAKGVMNAHAIAESSSSVEALTFGAEDFTRDIGATRTKDGDEIFLARSMLVMAAKAAGKQALDTVFSDVKDLDGLRRDTGKVKIMGFDGKGAIHPAQIEIIHDVFTPSEKELQYAVDGDYVIS